MNSNIFRLASFLIIQSEIVLAGGGGGGGGRQRKYPDCPNNDCQVHVSFEEKLCAAQFAPIDQLNLCQGVLNNIFTECTFGDGIGKRVCTWSSVEKRFVCNNADGNDIQCCDYKCLDGRCPASHKYAYFSGQYCCKYPREKVHTPSGKKRDGSLLEFDSTCCQDNAFTKCPKKTCRSHEVKGWCPIEQGGCTKKGSSERVRKGRFRLPSGNMRTVEGQLDCLAQCRRLKSGFKGKQVYGRVIEGGPRVGQCGILVQADCSPKFVYGDGTVRPCCSHFGWCGGSEDYCKCEDCIDFRKDYQVTACEAYWSDNPSDPTWNDGCWAHTEPIAKGDGSEGSHCWVMSKCQ